MGAPKSTYAARLRKRSLLVVPGLADLLAALGGSPLECPVGPAPCLGLPALELHVAPLGPHAGLEHQRKADAGNHDPAWAGNCTDQRRQDEQHHADPEERPLHHRMVDESAPLITRYHPPDVAMRRHSRKPLAGRRLVALRR